MIKIGFGEVGIFDRYYMRSIWENNGVLVFEGKASIGHGSKISTGKNAQLILGDNFIITANSSIVCCKHIQIKQNVLISWDVLIMDTDFHKIYDNDHYINPDSEIIIEEKVWIGCRALVLKGSHILKETVVAAGSIVNKEFLEENVLVGGSPSKIIRKNISWDL